MLKLKWKVSEAPTGRYRSFDHRGWPTAYYENGDIAFALYCGREYQPCEQKDGTQFEIKICVADHSIKPNWLWKTLKQRGKTLQEAKELATAFIEKYPTFVPESLKGVKK